MRIISFFCKKTTDRDFSWKNHCILIKDKIDVSVRWFRNQIILNKYLPTSNKNSFWSQMSLILRTNNKRLIEAIFLLSLLLKNSHLLCCRSTSKSSKIMRTFFWYLQCKTLLKLGMKSNGIFQMHWFLL
jgi:hypothetical protein